MLVGARDGDGDVGARDGDRDGDGDTDGNGDREEVAQLGHPEQFRHSHFSLHDWEWFAHQFLQVLVVAGVGDIDGGASCAHSGHPEQDWVQSHLEFP